MLGETIYLGIVENNIDPTNHGRIQVRWFGINPPYTSGQVPTEDLPWALLVNGTGGKFYSIPDNGDWVIGSFFDGREAQHPLVFGVINTAKNALPNTAVTDYLNLSALGPGLGPSDRAQQAYEYFVSKGLTPEQAAGIVGSLQQESGKSLDPTAFNKAGGGQGAQGIGQWRGKRIDAFKDRYGKLPKDASFEEQLDFVMYEFSTTEKSAYNRLKSTTTVEDAAIIFDKFYERSGGSTLGQRIQNSQSLLSAFNDATPSSTPNSGNSYLAPSNDVVNNYGSTPIPAQMSGENINLTPISLQYMNQNKYENDLPISGSIKSSVWQTKAGGGFIEMNGGDQEFINIVHQSGAYISIDPKGSITIKSNGDNGNFTQGNMFQGVEGTIMIQAGEGMNIAITNGAVNIESSQDINLTSHNNINLSAAGKVNITSGESTNISAAKVAITSTVEDIDISSKQNLLTSASSEVNIKSSQNTNIDGAEVYINSGKAKSAATADTQSKIPTKSVGKTPPVHSTLPSIGGGMIDDKGEII